MAATDDVPASSLPSLELDPFSDELLTDPLPFYRALCELGPVVWLVQHRCYALGRHHEVRRVLHDVSSFSSAAGVGMANLRTQPGIRSPSLILEADPPAHARPRAVLNRLLSAEAVEGLRAGFRHQARQLVAHLRERGSFDGVADCARVYALQVFPDAVGLGPELRENLVAYADLLFNANGPRNALFARSAERAQPLSAWILERCQRSQLRPGGLGEQLYQALDRGELSAEEAPLLVRSLLSAGVDTTVAALGNALCCLAERPEVWQRLRAEPELVRHAFEEALRFDSPSMFTFRTTTRAVELAGHSLPADQKLLLSFGAANRDARRWPAPDQFDVTRRPTGHVAFGSGIHACVGQVIARAEAEILLEELARSVERLELAGPPRRWLNNAVRSWASVPLRIR